MPTHEHIEKIFHDMVLPTIDNNFLKKLISVIDLTSLNDTDTQEIIDKLLVKAQNAYQPVAAVCVNPEWVSYVAKTLTDKSIKIATVVNFPHGMDSISSVKNQIKQAIVDGAQEIDVVFPYQQYMKQEESEAKSLIAACRLSLNENILLKVILETGELHELNLIEEASRDAFIAGADFIKTSTGKTAVGATLAAAAVMLTVIKSMTHLLHRPLGLKVSGGIATIDEAAQYIALANHMMGADWVSAQNFRIGASRLLDEVLSRL